MGWLLSLIPGVGWIMSLGSKVLSIASGWLKTWADHDVQVLQANVSAAVPLGTAAIQADAVANHDRLEMLKTFASTQYLINATLIPPILHQGMVFLDSTPFPFLWGDGWWPTIVMHVVGTWQVPVLPGEYAGREWIMISVLLGLNNANAIGQGFLRWLHK